MFTHNWEQLTVDTVHPQLIPQEFPLMVTLH